MIAEVTDSYYNMKEKIEPCMYLIDTAKEAMTAWRHRAGGRSDPRAGTDGARLSYMGLPCPTSAPADITIMENMNLFRWIRFRRRRRYW